jgi:predicted signal transduction protein with EAL and GGDEF domain
MFTKPAEVWVQFGLPARKHINCHPYCLHWWRHQHREMRLPPSYMVGPQLTAVPN